MIDKLKTIRDRILAVFGSSITRLEPDRHTAPDPRMEQLRQERAEAKKLLAELKQSYRELQQEIEKTDFSPLYNEDPEDAT